MTYTAVLQGPTAGRGRHHSEVEAALGVLRGADLDVRVLEADSVDAAVAACHQAVADRARALIAIGGDGTVHLAVQAAAASGVPFGVIPAGTGNDFAAVIGVEKDCVAAATAIAAAVTAGRTRPLDLGRVTGAGGEQRWFAAVLAAGFDAIVNERANAMSWPKGPRRYDLAVAIELLWVRARRYRVVLDGEVHEVDAILTAVGNTSSYGGGVKMCPAADPTDGLLDVLIGGPISRLTMLRLQPHLYKGTHVEHPSVRTYRARTVEISAKDITAYADGERLFPLPITVTAEAGALTLLA